MRRWYLTKPNALKAARKAGRRLRHKPNVAVLLYVNRAGDMYRIFLSTERAPDRAYWTLVPFDNTVPNA